MNHYSLAREYASPEINWQQQYKESITNIDTLCKELDLQTSQLPFSLSANQQFRLRVPRSYVRRMQKSNPFDPLLLQVLPHIYEENIAMEYSLDPVGDLQNIKSPGLIKKYHGRALLLTTSCCAIHCRYCFRRHFPYTSHNPQKDAWSIAIKKIASDLSIKEVILSGGDPLVLSESKLEKIIRQLESIKHVERLRIHTRLPATIPDRINSELIQLINNTKLQVVIVLHINHFQELDHQLQDKLRQLSASKCTLLNQSVLLRGINDNVDVLTKLSEALFKANVLPYYLHILDKVQGATHFEVSESKACEIMKELTKKLPGYLVPKLAKEEAGKPAKTLVTY